MSFSQAEETLAARFVRALRLVPAPVAVVTSYVDGRPWGLTVTANCTVSVDPPQQLVCLGRASRILEGVQLTGQFGLSFLAESQQVVAEQTAAPGELKFLEHATGAHHHGFDHEFGWSSVGLEAEAAGDLGSSTPSTPVIHGAYCHLHCRVARVLDGTTHAIVLGRVEESEIFGPAEPGLYRDRGFHALGRRLGDLTPPATT
jgi:flavin reductase (DIM6/NTAB) family NADH-FMN oxidoreductase RutF